MNIHVKLFMVQIVQIKRDTMQTFMRSSKIQYENDHITVCKQQIIIISLDLMKVLTTKEQTLM